MTSSTDSPCPDCSAFLNWSEYFQGSGQQTAGIVQSLVATVKLQPALDSSLEAKAVKFLESVNLKTKESAAAFLYRFASNSDNFSPNFIHHVVVLLSTPNQTLIIATMKMLGNLIRNCSAKVRFALVKTDLISQIIVTLNQVSLSFTEAVDIHINLTKIIENSLWLATPNGLTELGIKDGIEQQAVHETILKQIIAPSELYIWHLCMNRNSIVDGKLCDEFMYLLAWPVEICPYYQPTMDLILHMPVFITIPSCLTFFVDDDAIWHFLNEMSSVQREWNEEGEELREMWKKADRMLRMEGVEDVIDQKLLNDKGDTSGSIIVFESIDWNNQHGTNLPEPE
ncbi:hypothetical protein BLNAU_4835 [Blattamonas nauphoetae]|uniref:Uncharacterized protein n=1 Tax=Blattamonas nauphoetae TaxID=2049346 RepID=A0ABQ9Y946_9EUKA|nr:hypothetical protein BLNAU_4835 [Blattamonas nauphoetae]